MNHRMNDLIVLKRTETGRDERNRVTSVELPPRSIMGCIRAVESSWQRPANADPVEWEYKATLGFLLGEDVRKDDVLELSGRGDFVVVDVVPGRRFLAVVALQEKRGAE
ncbi:hypothetical protein NDK47_17715 [Brevibacillus ruminantium]|uniref:Head-tail adaptor protein n=1 Tax=Brevibacillus ruminantium TaxID=2950604 RepID=A0ABY4W9X3_9BACL|nr:MULTISPECIES: hypothetical protein [Brevibacillus]MED1882383.1 hypothetical protein [Brevibacillus borstelensis]RNB56663.1 hypothetical protein EDM54_23895 [Brevibacillus borstelensis]USG63987.1 hypothetical protein NDK47_17715 [Brevibacillus ruminantium]GED55452.1 hypothetical protein BBO01nite_46930 [Brevibacillus borstelensis]